MIIKLTILVFGFLAFLVVNCRTQTIRSSFLAGKWSGMEGNGKGTSIIFLPKKQFEMNMEAKTFKATYNLKKVGGRTDLILSVKSGIPVTMTLMVEGDTLLLFYKPAYHQFYLDAQKIRKGAGDKLAWGWDDPRPIRLVRDNNND